VVVPHKQLVTAVVGVVLDQVRPPLGSGGEVPDERMELRLGEIARGPLAGRREGGGLRGGHAREDTA
jgi:hypothetical protein